MDAFKLEAFKIALFILPGIITLRVKAALSILGAVRYHGWDFRLLRLLRLTNRTGENLVWAETLTKSAGQAYALVACKDGSRFIGEIDTFSEEAGNFEILLSDASQVRPDGSLLPIHGEGVLLTRENPIIRVELWRPGVSATVPPEGNVNV